MFLHIKITHNLRFSNYAAKQSSITCERESASNENEGRMENRNRF